MAGNLDYSLFTFHFFHSISVRFSALIFFSISFERLLRMVVKSNS